MKKVVSLLLAVCLVLTASVAAFAEEESGTLIKGKLKTKIKIAKSYPENPVIEGVSSTTGLPSSGEAYTPILLVLDNAEDAYPHWGISQADILFQIPNAGKGATKLMALFADNYPEQAGGARSGRATMLPIANAFDSAFAYAGPPATSGSNVSVDKLIKKWDIKKKCYNLLGNDFRERVKYTESPHNLSAHIKEIHEDLIKSGIEFTQHPFLFTDDPLDRGESASYISLEHYGDSKKKNSHKNNASSSTFAYDPEKKSYTRSSATGVNVDRDTNEPVEFANVIVIRTALSWQSGYPYYKNHLVNNGVAEIFQNGHYIQGAWVRKSQTSRIVFLDENGEELKFQRGKTFMVVTNDVTEVVYR